MQSRPAMKGKNTSVSRPATEKLSIWLVELKTGVEATYNPKKVTVDKSVPWAEHPGSKADTPSLEFTKGKPRVMSLELFFDTYETGENVYDSCIRVLELGTAVMEGKKGADARPPTCLVSWATEFPKFVGVIESMSVSYTMFFRNGAPCRATVTLKLKEPPKAARTNAITTFDKVSDDDRERALARMGSHRLRVGTNKEIERKERLAAAAALTAASRAF